MADRRPLGGAPIPQPGVAYAVNQPPHAMPPLLLAQIPRGVHPQRFPFRAGLILRMDEIPHQFESWHLQGNGKVLRTDFVHPHGTHVAGTPPPPPRTWGDAVGPGLRGNEAGPEFGRGRSESGLAPTLVAVAQGMRNGMSPTNHHSLRKSKFKLTPNALLQRCGRCQ